MKKIRRQTAKRTQKFNRKRYNDPKEIAVTARINHISGKKKKYKGTYVFKENGDYLRIQRIDKMKRYYPKYIPLYGGDALTGIYTIFI